MKPVEKFCAECPAKKRDDWRIRGAVLWMQLGRHDLRPRELQIAQFILAKTYGWHRDAVVIPQLRFFRQATGIGEPDVVKVLKSLHARRVIRIQTVRGQHTYSLNPDPETWKALPRLSTPDMVSSDNVLREINGLEPMANHAEGGISFFKPQPGAKKRAADIGSLPIGRQMGDAMSGENEFPNLF